MAFGNGFTGFLVASIVTLSSGTAFIICFREFFREAIAIQTEAQGVIVTSEVVEVESTSRVWENRASYLWMVGFLGLIGIAGFVAGLAHFGALSR